MIVLSIFLICSLQGSFHSKDIQASSLNQLIVHAVDNINNYGQRFNAAAGSGLQDFDVNYVLLDPSHRIPDIRGSKAITYFKKELQAYFDGSLDVAKLAAAAPFWQRLADEKNCINSNYGYYVFHQKLPKEPTKTQFDWIIDCFLKNKETRKAFITINALSHKDYSSKDFPCTVGIQFLIKDNTLFCVVSSRSTDVITGLPYDMGFFSFVHELVYKVLQQKDPAFFSIALGSTVMKTNFTQIYDKTNHCVQMLNRDFQSRHKMPAIDDGQAVLADIYNKTQHTDVMKWVFSCEH